MRGWEVEVDISDAMVCAEPGGANPVVTWVSLTGVTDFTVEKQAIRMRVHMKGHGIHTVRRGKLPFGSTGLVLGLLISGVGAIAAGGCQENQMNKDLKRQADRATIQLNQVETERDALKEEVTREKAATEAERKRADAAIREATELRSRLSQAENELRGARQQVRKLEDAALAARQGMPTTRSMQP